MDELKTWEDFADKYDMVLFNNCVNLNDNAVLQEWQEHHQCEAQDAGQHIQDCNADKCKKCEKYKSEYGDEPYCECEVYQWYAISVGEWGREYLNKKYELDIFYSNTLDIYFLPVYHFGTAWKMVNLATRDNTEEA